MSLSKRELHLTTAKLYQNSHLQTLTQLVQDNPSLIYTAVCSALIKYVFFCSNLTIYKTSAGSDTDM